MYIYHKLNRKITNYKFLYLNVYNFKEEYFNIIFNIIIIIISNTIIGAILFYS